MKTAAAAAAVSAVFLGVTMTAAASDGAGEGTSASTGSMGALPRIVGTFLDVQYDARLKYVNNVTRALSCSQWQTKIREFANFGVEYILFQAVHDDRFGAYYPSKLHAPWTGACADVVGTVLQAAASTTPAPLKVFLSAEYTGTEYDPPMNTSVMEGRLAIMDELVHRGYTDSASFYGWYFSAEAYLTHAPGATDDDNGEESDDDGFGLRRSTVTNAAPQARRMPVFPDAFIAYMTAMAAHARAVTPTARVISSPFGTRRAAAANATAIRASADEAGAATFVAQLRALGAAGVSYLAYQDEVGCVRDALPVRTAAVAFEVLRAAHDQAAAAAAAAGAAPVPALWANIESFTWEALPNNVTSALVPAPFPRIAAQMTGAAAAGIDVLISFSVQGMYQPASPVPLSPSSPSWGPPDALRAAAEYSAYQQQSPDAYNSLMAESFSGMMRHAARGATVQFPSAAQQPIHNPDSTQPDNATAHELGALLTNGITGGHTHRDSQWVAFSSGSSGATGLLAIIDLGSARTVRAAGARFLQQPAFHFVDGHTRANRDGSVFANGTAAVFAPPSLHVFVSNTSSSGWTALGTEVRTQWWSREAYDTRTELLLAEVDVAIVARYIKLEATNEVPHWADAAYAASWLFVDELVALCND